MTDHLVIYPEQRQLILGALDSLAAALADHDHHWTEGEREIYEQAVAVVAGEPGDDTLAKG